MQKIVVIGGGIAGLAAAYHLSKKARQENLPLEVTVLEAANYWGGKIVTDRVDGFVIEGGPDTFLRSKPWAVQLCRELGLEDRLQGTNPHQKNTYVLHGQRLRPLPEGLTMMVPTQFMPMLRTGLLSWPQKARMGLDFFLPSRPLDGDESLGNFVSRRLGRSAYENLIEPLMSGIYAGDGDQLSLQSTFPYLREWELKHGGLVKGALAARRLRARQSPAAGHPAPGGVSSPAGVPAAIASSANNRSIFLTPTNGLAEIVDGLTARLSDFGVDLRLNAAVQRIEALHDPANPPEQTSVPAGRYRIWLEKGESLSADAIILATPAFAAGQLLAELDPGLSHELQAIPYVSTATVSMAYRQADLGRPLDGYGYVIPRREGRKALACTWTSTKFPHRAPQDSALLRVFIGRAGQEAEIPWDEAGLLELAKEEVRLTLGIDASPLLWRVFIWERAMPQYNIGHPQRLERIEAALQRWPGIALAGNGYRGIGIPDCIHSGQQAAEYLL
jgi:oxygen-dependent protoporphyrinogen oxidase